MIRSYNGSKTAASCATTRGILLLALLITATPLMVEEVGGQTIATDRPDFADATSTVAVGVLQVESGYSFSRNLGDREHTLGEWMLRTGLSDRAEIRIGVDSYKYNGGSGFGDGSVDFRIRLYQGKPEPGIGSFNLSLLAGAILPTGSRRYRSNRLQPTVMLTSDVQLNRVLTIAPAVNYVLRSDNLGQHGEFSAGGSLVFSLGKRTFWYVETFGTTVEGPAEQTIASAGGGLLWLARENFQFDLHFLSALNGSTPNYNFGVGVSFYTGLK